MSYSLYFVYTRLLSIKLNKFLILNYFKNYFYFQTKSYNIYHALYRSDVKKILTQE